MKKGTRKCPECGKYSAPYISSYYRGKKGRVSVIKRRKEPIITPRKTCAHCYAKLDKEGNDV